MTILENVRKTKILNTNLLVLNCIKKRFSPRVFSSSPIPQSDLNTIFEAARLAPSARNHQPWFFYYAKKGTAMYEKLFTCIVDRNFWAKTAPIIVIACYDPTEPNDEVNRWATYDLGAAVLSLVLQATELGYHCRQIGSFDCNGAKQKFSIPDPFLPFTLIAVGKMGTEEDYKKANPEIIKKELEPNTRKSVIFQELNSSN